MNEEFNNSLTTVPVLSIVIPLYNKSLSIEKTLESILSQSYKKYEVIVVNDGSTDDSAAKVRQVSDNRVRLISQRNGGVSSARNTGIKHAKGKWILFMDADDMLLEDAIKTLMTNIVDEKTIIAGNFLIDNNGTQKKYLQIRSSKFFSSEKEIYRSWVFRTLFIRTGSFIMPTITAKQELFDETLSRYEDLDFLFRCYRYLNVFLIPNVLMVYNTSFAEASKPVFEKWKRDYLFYLPFEVGKFWKNMVLGEMVKTALISYPEKKDYILNKYKPYKRYMFYSTVMHYCSALRRILVRIFIRKLY